MVVWPAGNGPSYNIINVAYVNGGFTLDLPASVDDKYLYTFDEKFDVLPESIKVSNPNVKMTDPSLSAYKWDPEATYNPVTVGYIYYGTTDILWRGNLWYVDGDVTITGSSKVERTVDGLQISKTTVYSINAKKGWNIVYKNEVHTDTETTESETETHTTNAPAGAKWYLYVK
jgi:hypothetical protein